MAKTRNKEPLGEKMRHPSVWWPIVIIGGIILLFVAIGLVINFTTGNDSPPPASPERNWF